MRIPGWLEEWVCSVHKRMRITESLKGHTWTVISALKVLNASATAQEYLDVQTGHFGAAGTAEQLYVLFQTMEQ